MDKLLPAGAIVVETEISFTLVQLGRACRGNDQLLMALVDEGVLAPEGGGPADWVFAGTSLSVARKALRLIDDLDLSPAGAALVLELLAQIDGLTARLHVAGADPLR
jgi:chaperone modulatory protein CbpM